MLYEHSKLPHIFKLAGEQVTFKNVEQVHVLPVSIDKDVEQAPHPCLTHVEVLPVITSKKRCGTVASTYW